MISFNLKNIGGAALMGAVLLGFSSCADELPEPMLQPRTTVTVQTDWSGVGENNRPASYILAVNDEAQTLTSPSTEMVLKSNKDYTFVAYVPVPGLTVSDTFVQADASQFSAGGNAVNGNPSTLYYGAQSVASLTGEQASVTIPMQQATRRLNISLRTKVSETDSNGNPCAVQGGYVILSDAYSTFNMLTSLYSTSAEAVSEFVFDESTATLSVPFNLFGLNLEKNVDIEVVMFLSNGTQQHVKSTITDLVRDFNDGLRSDVNISARMALDGAGATVSDWTVVDLGEIEPEKK